MLCRMESSLLLVDWQSLDSCGLAVAQLKPEPQERDCGREGKPAEALCTFGREEVAYKLWRWPGCGAAACEVKFGKEPS